MNFGSPLGLGELVENCIEGKCPISSFVYLLDVHIMMETLVKRVVIEE